MADARFYLSDEGSRLLAVHVVALQTQRGHACSRCGGRDHGCYICGRAALTREPHD